HAIEWTTESGCSVERRRPGSEAEDYRRKDQAAVLGIGTGVVGRDDARPEGADGARFGDDAGGCSRDAVAGSVSGASTHAAAGAAVQRVDRHLGGSNRDSDSGWRA